jgi:hypothetical protein
MMKKIMLFLAVAVAVPCAAAEFPKRNPGHWQITITSDSSPTRIEEMCTDAATDAALFKFAIGASDKLCQKNEWRSLGSGRYSVDAVCAIGKTQLTVHGDTTFTGDTAYREEVRTHYDPPMRGRSETMSLRVAKWVGACASDMRPGDIVERSSGMRLNVNDMVK